MTHTFNSDHVPGWPPGLADSQRPATRVSKPNQPDPKSRLFGQTRAGQAAAIFRRGRGRFAAGGRPMTAGWQRLAGWQAGQGPQGRGEGMRLAASVESMGCCGKMGKRWESVGWGRRRGLGRFGLGSHVGALAANRRQVGPWQCNRQGVTRAPPQGSQQRERTGVTGAQRHRRAHGSLANLTFAAT